eukprot:GHVU01020385.1.p1 GENE.GHVU01020385.1~~GHVU01020385.1.p1  ORF type:complete len:205 (+),score=18.40 GHVU01020385.1:442-1056(+)
MRRKSGASKHSAGASQTSDGGVASPPTSPFASAAAPGAATAPSVVAVECSNVELADMQPQLPSSDSGESPVGRLVALPVRSGRAVAPSDATSSPISKGKAEMLSTATTASRDQANGPASGSGMAGSSPPFGLTVDDLQKIVKSYIGKTFHEDVDEITGIGGSGSLFNALAVQPQRGLSGDESDIKCRRNYYGDNRMPARKRTCM